MLGLSALSGCLPLPYPPIANNKITEQTLMTIQPGTSTRADVLLTLADPTIRGDQDNYFIYNWQQGHGGLVFFMGGGGGAAPVAALGSGSCNSFVISFTPDGRVRRMKEFAGKARATGGSLLSKTDSSIMDKLCGDPELSKAIDDWLHMEPERD